MEHTAAIRRAAGILMIIIGFLMLTHALGLHGWPKA